MESSYRVRSRSEYPIDETKNGSSEWLGVVQKLESPNEEFISAPVLISYNLCCDVCRSYSILAALTRNSVHA